MNHVRLQTAPERPAARGSAASGPPAQPGFVAAISAVDSLTLRRAASVQQDRGRPQHHARRRACAPISRRSRLTRPFSIIWMRLEVRSAAPGARLASNSHFGPGSCQRPPAWSWRRCRGARVPRGSRPARADLSAAPSTQLARLSSKAGCPRHRGGCLKRHERRVSRKGREEGAGWGLVFTFPRTRPRGAQCVARSRSLLGKGMIND